MIRTYMDYVLDSQEELIGIIIKDNFRQRGVDKAGGKISSRLRSEVRSRLAVIVLLTRAHVKYYSQIDYDLLGKYVF